MALIKTITMSNIIIKKLKNKVCRICKFSYEPRSSFQVCCSYPCANKYAKKHLKKESEQKYNDTIRKFKSNLKTLTEFEAEARKVFQAWVRERDKLESCISCNKQFCDNWQGGHWWKAEIYSGLIFNEYNCNKQCHKCNHFLNGNESEYRLGLIKKIGEDKVRWLEENKDVLRDKKYTREEYTEIKQLYKFKLIELKISNQ